MPSSSSPLQSTSVQAASAAQTASDEQHRRSYSPLSDAGVGDEDVANAPSPHALSSGDSSSLSEIEDDDVQSAAESDQMSASELSDAVVEADGQDVDSENETEAETERLDISPQKGRMQLMAHDPTRATEGLGKGTSATGKRLSDLVPEDTLEDDRNQSDTSASEADEPLPGKDHSPVGLAGRKRKRNGQLSPPSGSASMDDLPARKRSSARRRQSENPTAKLLYTNGLNPRNTEEAVSSNEDEEILDPLDEPLRPPVSPPTPKAVGLNEDNSGLVDLDDNAEADNDDDDEAEEAEAAAKTEDECKNAACCVQEGDFADILSVARKKLAYDSFKPIEKLFAIFRDRVFDERWTELSAELDLLEDPNTTHPLFAGQRDACDFRRDEKIRLENVALEYKMKCLRNKVLASRAQVLAQCYQKIRAIRDDTLTELNRDFCQVQKERRQFKSVEPHYIFQFEADRARQVENQVKYNKEVSLLSGIAKYRGFPSAPPLQGVLAEDLDADFQAMRIPAAIPNGRNISYAAQIANSARADEIAAEQNFLEQTPWANPNHPMLQQARAADPQATRPQMSTPSGSAQTWMMSGGVNNSTTTDHRPQGKASLSKEPTPYTKQNTNSPFDPPKRSSEPKSRESGQHKNGRPRNNGTPGTNPRIDKVQLNRQRSIPVDHTSIHQPFATSALHSNRSIETMATQTFGPVAGSFGTPMIRTPDPDQKHGEDRARARENEMFQASSSATPAKDGRFGADTVASSVGVR